jgi:hypothetical protein
MFPFAALGTGLGQFAQDYQRQQEVAKQTMMLQMQIADFQRKLRAEQNETDALSATFNFDPSALFGGGRPSPIQGLPQAASLPQGGGAGANPPAFVGQPADQFSRQQQPGSAFEGQFNVGQIPPPRVGASWLDTARPPPQLGGSPVLNGQAASGAERLRQEILARGGSGSPGGGSLPAPASPTQMAQAGPQMEPPPEDVTKITTRDIALLLRAQNPTMSSAALAIAAQKKHTDLMKDYEVKLKAWQAITSARGEAAGRAEAGRHNVATETQAGAALEETQRSAKELEKDRATGRRLEGRRTATGEKAQAGTSQRFADKAATAKNKADTEAQLVKNLINEVETLAAVVQSNPSLVGASGVVGRPVGSVLEQAGPVGQAIGGRMGVRPEDYRAQDDFKSRLAILRGRLTKELLSVRQFSGPAKKAIDEILPGLEVLSSASGTAQSLRNVSRVLQQNLAAMEQAGSVMSDDVSKLTDAEILRAIGEAAPAAQQ